MYWTYGSMIKPCRIDLQLYAGEAGLQVSIKCGGGPLPFQSGPTMNKCPSCYLLLSTNFNRIQIDSLAKFYILFPSLDGENWRD